MKTFLICNAIVRSVAFICITFASIYFRKPSLLWWYVVPVLMAPSTEED
jgi:hypothetical protein